MQSLITRIISDILTTLYQSFWCALIIAMTFMFVYLFIRENGGGREGFKKIIGKWKDAFFHESSFRRYFLFFFYVALILFRTLLNRKIWLNPLSDVIGPWLFGSNANASSISELIENVLLFIPFTLLLFWSRSETLLKEKKGPAYIMLKSLKITFLFSLTIEMSQLIFHLGTFQLSDLFHNTLGGVIGGGIYCIIHFVRISRHKM